MVTEDREMLAKELSSRLPYGVMVSIEQYDGTTIQRKLIAVCYKGLESSLYVDGVEGFWWKKSRMSSRICLLCLI